MLRLQISKLKVTQEDLADAMKVSRLTVNQICNDERTITANVAVKLEHVTGISAERWMRCQMRFDLAAARQWFDTKGLKVLHGK